MNKDRLIIATDIDGTITDKKRRISTEVINIFRELQSRGAVIIFISSHTFPAVSAIGHYVGVDYIIAETGSCIGKPWEPFIVEKLEDRDKILELVGRMGFRQTQSNPYRLADIALYPPENVDPILATNKLREVLSEYNVDVVYSGYAIHVYKKGVSKSRALKMLLEYVGLDGFLIGFGDGLNDIDFLSSVDFSATGCESPEELKSVVNFVGGETTLDAVLTVLNIIRNLYKSEKHNIQKLQKFLRALDSARYC